MHFSLKHKLILVYISPCNYLESDQHKEQDPPSLHTQAMEAGDYLKMICITNSTLTRFN